MIDYIDIRNINLNYLDLINTLINTKLNYCF